MAGDSTVARCTAAESEVMPQPAIRCSAIEPAKRAADIFITLLMITVLAPMIALIALLLWLRDGRPVLYRHRRVGQGGAAFDCLKFRTMAKDSDRLLQGLLARCPQSRTEWMLYRKLRDDPRINGRIGALLRRTSLDELPQLINVLRGEMSLVGPRPVTKGELPLYGSSLQHYLSARPGITGPWQISGRSNITFDERVALDVDYIHNHSFVRDILILAQTALVVLRHDGVY